MNKKLYPKTARLKDTPIMITEKLDGSNLGIFKLNGELLFAQRNNIYRETELNKDNSYKGLSTWLKEHRPALELINEGSGVFGEWLGMGQIKYDTPFKFHVFCKARIDLDYNITRLNYDFMSFPYVFSDENFPDCLPTVPIVAMISGGEVKVSDLDKLYEQTIAKVDRKIEGFVVIIKNTPHKYVRMKNGRLTDHFTK